MIDNVNCIGIIHRVPIAPARATFATAKNEDRSGGVIEKTLGRNLSLRAGSGVVEDTSYSSSSIMLMIINVLSDIHRVSAKWSNH